MRKVRVLLLDLKTYYPSPPYQLGLVVEYARLEPEVRRCIEFVFVAASRQQPPRAIARAIVDAEPDLVALSNYAWTQERVCATLAILEGSGRPLPRIVIGGPNSSGRFGDEMLRRHRSISALVEGEGEPAFRDICASLADDPQRDPFARARNCVVRDDAGVIHRPDPNHRIELLDDVPSPYLSGLLPARPSPIFYETNRGCPYRCAFCYWGNGNAKIYRMSAERIRAEMEYFARAGVSSFWLADANFGIFDSDAAIAETIAEINQRTGRPFKHVGVNWAKQSSDRVLEIAKIFRAGGMGCTTTIALQSVTPAAEQTAKRYSLPARRFASLIRKAALDGLDTYTDIIWGLPGETIAGFLDGLEAVIASGVPAIMIHQLYLLPGTEFFERRHELGLEILADAHPGGRKEPRDESEQRSDFAEYVVVSHPAMSRDDMVRGARMIAVNHLLHNHDLGRVVIFFLARFGLGTRQAYEFFDRILLDDVPGFAGPAGGLLAELRQCILGFADDIGRDPYVFHFRLSNVVWFKTDADGRRRSRCDELVPFLQQLFAALCAEHGIALDGDDRWLLDELVAYNVLIAPKPAWRPQTSYALAYDVDRIWSDMQRTIHDVAAQSERSWPALAAEVAEALRKCLTTSYLAAQRGAQRYSVRNEWRIAPVTETADWLLSSRSRHCTVQRIGD
jgi:radical SAM superfamily enzyme YgiQ (UPF0313 family)